MLVCLAGSHTQVVVAARGIAIVTRGSAVSPVGLEKGVRVAVERRAVGVFWVWKQARLVDLRARAEPVVLHMGGGVIGWAVLFGGGGFCAWWQDCHC